MSRAHTVGGWLATASANVQIERMCVAEFMRLCRRDRRHLGGALAMYARTIHSPGRAQTMRATYCLARYLDDALDGDREVREDPETHATSVLREAEFGRFAGANAASRLASFVFPRLAGLSEAGDDLVEQMTALVRIMLFDRERARKGILLEGKELQQHHWLTYYYSLNITLRIVGSKLGANDLGDIIRAQSRLYTIRDLNDDLSRGLVNVPVEVLEAVSDVRPPDLSYPALLRCPTVRAWLKEELALGVRHVRETADFLAGCNDRRAKMVVRPLYRGLRSLARRLPKALE